MKNISVSAIGYFFMLHALISNGEHPIVEEAYTFISSCTVPVGDSYFEPGSSLILTQRILDSNLVLYIEENGMHKYMATMLYDSDEGPFFEAQGGIYSTILAKDVFEYLAARPFSLNLDDKRAVLSATKCAIDYCGINKYEGIKRNNDNCDQ